MKRFFPILATAVLLAALSASCTKVDCVYPDKQDYWIDCDSLVRTPDTITVDTSDTTDTTDTVVGVVNTKRNVLLEEFTGVGCGNCPAANIEALSLYNQFQGRLVLVGMHAGWFSSGNGNLTGFELTAADAEDYYTSFNVQSNPIGMINRKSVTGDPNKLLISTGSWEAAIQDAIDNTPDADMTIATMLNYNTGTRTIDLSATINVVNDRDGDYRFVAYLVEDKIIGVQVDYSKDPQQVNDYEHRHVFRDAMTDIWGDFVFEDDATAGATADVTVDSYTIPQEYNADNCTVVVYVYNDITKEVVQVEELHL